MGNNNSTTSKVQGGQAAKVASTEPQYVPKQRKPSKQKKVKVVSHGAFPEQHGKKPLDDDTFTNYIRSAKHIIRSLTNIGRHEEHRNPAPDHVPNGNSNINKEDERDHFSDFIQNARKKFRTVTSIGKDKSFKKG